MRISETKKVIRNPDRISTGITVRGLILGGMTVVGMALYMTYWGRNLVKTYLPVAAMLPFVGWVGVNLALKLTFPRVALSRTEMLTVLCMVWVAGNLPAVGWASYMISDIAAPSYFASPENRVQDVIVPYLPAWLFPENSPTVIGQLYSGLRPNQTIPWGGWVRPLFWWLAGSLALVASGFFASTIFFKQWFEKERLVFPMAQFPMALLEETEGRRMPPIFYDRIFWLGFAFTAGIIGWNIIGYFVLTLPRITLFAQYLQKAVHLGRYYPDYYLRVQPMIMGLAYLCPLDILFSFWFYNLVMIFKEGLVNRTGFAIGLPGQAATAGELTMLESHGALVFLVAWSVWVARRHLKETLEKALSPNRIRDDGAPVTYRTAWLGFTASAIFLGGWCMSAGMAPWVTLLHLVLMFICFFGIAKYAATTGFVFLSPAGGKGADILMALGGTSNMPPATQTAMWLVNSNCLVGVPIRTTAIPAVAHYFRMLGNRLKRHPLVWGCIPIAFAIGFAASAGVQLYRCYTEGALNGLTAAYDWDVLVGRVSMIEGAKLTYFDPQKVGVWLAGIAEAGVLTYLKAHVSWWPFHPIALAFPEERYAFCLLLVWLMKTVVIRYGGVQLYRRSLPFWYGAIVGYLFGIGLSHAVDMIWFPGGGHGVHGW